MKGKRLLRTGLAALWNMTYLPLVMCDYCGSGKSR